MPWRILFGNVMNKRLLFKIGIGIAWAYFSYLMLLITLQYIPIDFEAAFLGIKQDEIKLWHYQIAFFTHVYSSIFSLLLGGLQFSRGIRRSAPKFHRSIGKIYVGIVLFLAGPSGLVMAYYANGGIYAQLSFALLSILWIYFTWRAYVHARQKDWRQHQNFIYRSYALTLSAISLRLFKWMIVGSFALAPMDTYRIVAWLGWLFNWAVAEIIIHYWKREA